MAILGKLLLGYEFGLLFLLLFSVGVAFLFGGETKDGAPHGLFFWGWGS